MFNAAPNFVRASDTVESTTNGMEWGNWLLEYVIEIEYTER